MFSPIQTPKPLFFQDLIELKSTYSLDQKNGISENYNEDGKLDFVVAPMAVKVGFTVQNVSLSTDKN